MKYFDKNIKKKFTLKLIANVISMFLGIISQIIVPRALGPVMFGQMSYLNSFFQQIFSSLDLGFINYFYTKFSNSKKKIISSFYLLFFFSISFLILILSIILTFTDMWKIFSVSSNQFFLYSFFWAFLYSLSLIFDKCSDALGLTIKAEKIRIFNKIFFVCLLVILVVYDNLNLKTFYYYSFLLYVSLLVQFYFLFTSHNIYIFSEAKKAVLEFLTLFSNFFSYSKHLIWILIFSSIAIIFDRWLVQYDGGDVQQGFYSFAFIMTSICLTFTSAFVPLIWREISLNSFEDNKPYLCESIQTSFRFLFIIAVSISCFLYTFSDIFTLIAGGEKYRGAILTVMIMSLYPIHQTYGQLSSSMFMALSQTKLYSKISLSYIVPGILLSPIIILNKDLIGIESSSLALAIKMLGLQYLAVNTQLYFNCKHAEYSFIKLMIHQHLSIFLILFMCITIRYIYTNFFLIDNLILILMVSLFSLLLLLTFASYFFKEVFGIKSHFLDKFKKEHT